MRLSFLKHLLDSVTALARPVRVCVLGSSSLLPQHPDLGDAGQPLELSLDADLLLEPVNQHIADMLKDAVGHESSASLIRGGCGRITTKRRSVSAKPHWRAATCRRSSPCTARRDAQTRIANRKTRKEK